MPHAPLERDSPDEQQSLRFKRFLMAGSTYVLGLSVLGLCVGFGLLPWRNWCEIAVAFGLVNLVFFAIFVSGWNRRFADPSLTGFQLFVAVLQVALILVRGRELLVVVVPFYSVLFVFGMLRLSQRGLMVLALHVALTYAVAAWARTQVFAGELDMREEALTGVLVVASTLWFAAAAGYISGLRARLRESVRELERIAVRDALTGLWNRRHLEHLLHKEVQRAVRMNSPLCVALADIDHFKSINDRFGHAAGDAALKQVAETLLAALRAGDELGRWGGEEFVFLLPATDLPNARLCAERMREAVAARRLAKPEHLALSVSIGVAALQPGESASALLVRADRAMYRAKEEGRDRVCAAD